MKNLKIKVICGYRADQQYTIDIEESHKAYYLFIHPNERGIFRNGVAIRGQDIQSIVPDYHATMGWNPSHILQGDDWNELRSSGVLKQLTHIMSSAKEIAQIGSIKDLEKPLTALLPSSVDHKDIQVRSIREIIRN